MNRTYDIFRTLSDSTPIWVDAVVGLEQARKRLTELPGVESTEYLIYDSRMATFVKPHTSGATFHATEARDIL